MTEITKNNLDFLKKLSKNNNRDWFQKNKDWYTESQKNMIAFSDKVLADLNKIDELETETGKKALYRIYRDVRFSKDKSPYKVHWGMIYKRLGAERRGSYYIHIKPGEMMIGGGFYKPEPKDLKLIRAQIAQEPKRFRKILGSKKFKETFVELQGEQVKTAPKGYDKDHPAIDLLKFKSLYVFKNFTDKEALAKDFHKEVNKCFKTIRPYFDYMTEILTHDLNGESLLK